MRPGLIHRPGDGTRSGRLVCGAVRTCDPPYVNGLQPPRLLYRQEVRPVGQHAVQRHRELARKRDLGFAHGGQAHPPALQGGALHRPGQDDVGSLIHAGAHTAVPDLGALAADNFSMVPGEGGLLGRITQDARRPAALPGWITDADIDFYAGEFLRTGFRGGLNWYRNIDRNWEQLLPFAGARVTIPALYVAGERDLVPGFPGARDFLANLPKFVPQLRKTMILPGCGHWTQQSGPARSMKQ
jgi:pimeloyl-ACP methyl ester carboxylesterase